MVRASGLYLVILIGLAGCGSGDPDLDRLQSAREALKNGNLADAQKFAGEIAPANPHWAEGQLILGAVALQSGSPKQALERYRDVPRDNALYPAALVGVAAIEQDLGNLEAAIRDFEAVLQLHPDDDTVRRSLAKLLASTGQRRRADYHFWALATANAIDFKQLVLLTDFDRRDPNDAALLSSCEQHSPRDAAVQSGLAAEAFSKGDLADARRRLELAVSIDPLLSGPQGLLGELLVEEGEEECQRWFRGLPSAIRDDPEIWFVLGLLAQRHEPPEIATHCFWIAAKAMPASYRIVYKFGLADSQSNPAGGGAVLAYARLLFDLQQNLSQFLNSRTSDRQALKRVVDLLIESGREWEARCWALYARDEVKHTRWAEVALKRLTNNPPPDGSRFADSKIAFDRHRPPEPAGLDEFLASLSTEAGASTSSPRNSQVRFRDESSDLGIEFVYHQGHVAGTQGVRIQESTGGGVAVLDYDGDDLPDLYFTQGHDWPPDSDFGAPSEKYQDRLFRNRGDRFQDVSRIAGIVFEEGFGQGCAAGDFDNDGFPDLYIANVGKNQLLINQGDGTFKDATGALPKTPRTWTSSCLIADLNNDGHPDLFDVNYLEGPGLYRRTCNETECTPQAHKPAADRLFLSQGDGSLTSFDLEVDSRWGSGLGIVAFQIEGPASNAVRETRSNERSSATRLSLFIANDHEPKFLLINAPAETPAGLALTDEAFLRGVAVNKDGRPTASMGIASGDANGDGLLDFFVTNFRNEASNLYLQNSEGLFEDAISGSGLLIPCLPYVKWGTQFLDADNDGDLDLVVANGHVGDFHTPGVECYMPTQFFNNDGSGRFTEIRGNEIGDYFDRKLLGRALALFDWNRDGLVDIVASPIASSAAVLTNRTRDAGNSIWIRLHAVSTARDAIGATVTITTASGQNRQQVTAGDGYQASNERILRFGLGDHTEVEAVVHWPNGTTQAVERLGANALWAVVEGKQPVKVRDWVIPH